MRLIDADALKEEINKKKVVGRFNTLLLIDNAPAVEPFEPDYVGAERVAARQRGYVEGYHNGMRIGKTLNPKIKQGEWIEESSEVGAMNIKYTWYKCSECGFEHSLAIPKNFCPNCGADMRKGGAE